MIDNFPVELQDVSWSSVAIGGAADNVINGVGDLNQTLVMPADSSIEYTITATVAEDAFLAAFDRSAL